MRAWFNFAFSNPKRVKPIHTSLYSWLVELNNRRGWIEEFASPASQSMAAVGIASYTTYSKTLSDLVEWKFVTIVQPSINQYTACIVALSINGEATYKALDKALLEHDMKQTAKHGEYTKTRNQETDETINTLTINLSSATAEIDLQKKKIKDRDLRIVALESENADLKKKIAKRANEPVTPHWEIIVKEWFEFYAGNFEGAEPSFEPEDRAALKKLAKKLQTRVKKAPATAAQEWDEGLALEWFKKFLALAWTKDWMRDNFLMPILNSKFDSIINKNEQAINNAANSTGTAGRTQGAGKPSNDTIADLQGAKRG